MGHLATHHGPDLACGLEFVQHHCFKMDTPDHTDMISRKHYLVHIHLLKCRLDMLEVADVFVLQMCVELDLFQQYRACNQQQIPSQNNHTKFQMQSHTLVQHSN